MPGALNIKDFTEHDKVVDCLQQLRNRFGEDGERLIVSDVLDEEGHQFVNLVQKGGGVTTEKTWIK